MLVAGCCVVFVVCCGLFRCRLRIVGSLVILLLRFVDRCLLLCFMNVC